MPRSRLAAMPGVVLLLAACASDHPAASVEPVAPTGSSSSLGEWQPPSQPLPSADSGLRDRLGQYAELVLGDGARVTHGSPEHMAYLEACVESAGFDATVEGDGLAVRYGDQRAYYEQVRETCFQAAVDSGLVAPQGPLDEEFLAAQYEAFLLTYECMVREGYPVTDPPSKDAYIESEGVSWHPYERLGGDPSAIEAKCPQDLVVLFEMMASGSKP